MKSYVATTGVMFALLVAVHVWRAVEEGAHLATDPAYVFITALAAAMAFWAWRVFRTIRS
jgi:hypothetical protein